MNVTSFATHSVATAALMFLNDVVLKPHGAALSADDLGYALVVVNGLAHAFEPVVSAIAARVMKVVTPAAPKA